MRKTSGIWLNAHKHPVLWTFLRELDPPVRLGKQGMIAPDTHIYAGMVAGAALANQNVTGHNNLIAKFLDAKAFGF